jgi:hypothetical protein
LLRNIDVALLRTFAAVADHRSMSAAGRALHLTQDAVSQQIGNWIANSQLFLLNSNAQ